MMFRIRTKLLYLILVALLLALMAAPIGGMVIDGYIAGDDYLPALTTDTVNDNPPALAGTCNGGSNGQCGG